MKNNYWGPGLFTLAFVGFWLLLFAYRTSEVSAPITLQEQEQPLDPPLEERDIIKDYYSWQLKELYDFSQCTKGDLYSWICYAGDYSTEDPPEEKLHKYLCTYDYGCSRLGVAK